MGEKNAYRLFVGKQNGKRPLGRSSRRCVDNNNKDVRETEWGDMDCIDLEVYSEHGQESSGSTTCCKILE
jgi:hypothetical protein